MNITTIKPDWEDQRHSSQAVVTLKVSFRTWTSTHIGAGDCRYPHNYRGNISTLICVFKGIAWILGGFYAIPREQFQQASDTTENNILNFLKEHPEEAYNAKEIAEAFWSYWS